MSPNEPESQALGSIEDGLAGSDPRLASMLLWAVTSAALLGVALVLNTSGHKACIQSMGTACPASPVPQHADASHVMNLRLLAEVPSRTNSRQAAHSLI